MTATRFLSSITALAGITIAASLLQAGSAQAATLTQWNFNSVPADANPATGILTPNIGAGTVSRIGGTTGTPPFATAEDGGGSSDPLVGDDSALNTTTFPAATALNKSAGVEFKGSTVGRKSVEVIIDQYFSATSSKFAQFQYSLDGKTFVDFGSQIVGAVNAWSNSNTFNLSSIAGANNNENFAFRIVSTFAPNATGYAGTGGTYATDGQWRFDMATINADATPVLTPVPTAVPEPTTMAGLALAGIAFATTRRKRKGGQSEVLAN